MATVILSPLQRADGSSTFASNGYTVIAAVNGPIDIQRRDELPEEAAVDIAVRPAVGVGGVRERHLESIVQNTLRQVILVSAHPRTLIQITLQIVAPQNDGPNSGNSTQTASNLPVLPALLQASVLALLSTSIPLCMTFTTTLIAAKESEGLIPSPSSPDIKAATSIHVLAFSSHGDLLVVESEGFFSLDTWKEIHDKARLICHGEEKAASEGKDVSMNSEDSTKMEDVLSYAMRQKIAREHSWKSTLLGEAT